MGVGKTAQSIWAADIAGRRLILVICPGIARVNWSREFEKWQQTPRTIGIVVDTQTVPETEVVIVSYNALLFRKILAVLISRSWDQIIIDESHMLKNRGAQRTQVVFGAPWNNGRGLAQRGGGTWLLSGTPFPNGPHEAWTFAQALFPDAVEGMFGYPDWEAEFCVTEPGTYAPRIVGIQNTAEFARRLKPHIKRRLLRDVQPDLPPARFGHVVVKPDTLPPLPPDVPEEIALVLEAAVAKLSADSGETEEFGDDAASEALAWLQSAHLSSLRKWTGIAKAPAVAELIRQELSSGLEKIVIFAVHREVIEILKNGIPGAVVIHGGTSEKTRQSIIDAFQGRVPGINPQALICNIEIASTALTLTASADVAFAETTWVPKDVKQGFHRCWRVGQTRPVLVRIFSLAGSLDEVVGNTLIRKSNLVSALETQFSTAS